MEIDKKSKNIIEPLISVIVPVYGAERYLDKCVESIIGQTYSKLEIILVDDGSKDNSGAMCDEYEAFDDRITVIHKENGGLMSAWMAGVDASNGEILCFIDSDDWVEKQMILNMAKELSDGKKQIICCNNFIDRQGGSQIPVRHGAEPGEYTREKLQREIFDRILGNENRTISMSRCMKLISRLLITGNTHYCDKNIKMGEDVNIMLPAILDADRIVVMKDSFYYHYYYNEVSMVHKYDNHLDENNKLLLNKITVIMNDKQNVLSGNGAEQESESRKMISREKQYLFMLQLKNEFRNEDKNLIQRVTLLCKETDIHKCSKENPIEVHGAANKLLYAVIKNPSKVNILVAGLLFKLKNS